MGCKASNPVVLILFIHSILVALASGAPRPLETDKQAGLPVCEGSRILELDSYDGKHMQVHDWYSAKNKDDPPPTIDDKELPSTKDYNGILKVVDQASKTIFEHDDKYCSCPRSDETPPAGDGNPDEPDGGYPYILGENTVIMACQNKYAIMLYNNRTKEHPLPEVRIRCKSVGMKIAQESAVCFEPFNEAKHIPIQAFDTPGGTVSELDKMLVKIEYDAAQTARRINTFFDGKPKRISKNFRIVTKSFWSDDPTWSIIVALLDGDCPDGKMQNLYAKMIAISNKDKKKLPRKV